MNSTQSGIQDIAIMRSMPRMKVLSHQLLDYQNIRALFLDCPSYLRIARNEVPEIYDDNFLFVEGSPVFHCDGNEIILLSSGLMVHNCIEASKLLKQIIILILSN